MLARVEFTIPGRPTAWARAGGNAGADGRGARRFTPHKQRAAMRTVQQAWKARSLQDRRNAPMLSGALKLEVLCVYAIPVSWSPSKREAARRGLVWKTSVPDWDNLGKLVGDALNGHAYTDDAMIAVASVAKRYGDPERTVIRVSELEPWEAALAALGLPDKPQRALPL